MAQQSTGHSYRGPEFESSIKQSSLAVIDECDWLGSSCYVQEARIFKVKIGRLTITEFSGLQSHNPVLCRSCEAVIFKTSVHFY